MTSSNSNPHATTADRLFREFGDEVRDHLRTFEDDVADRATSFAFVQVLRGFLPEDHPSPIGWLKLVAYREALRLQAEAKEDREATESLDADLSYLGDGSLTGHDVVGDVGSDAALHVEVNESLHLLKHLRPAQAKVLFLHWAGFDYDEIGVKLGVTRTWINRHMYEGRQALRRLRDEGENS